MGDLKTSSTKLDQRDQSVEGKLAMPSRDDVGMIVSSDQGAYRTTVAHESEEPEQSSEHGVRSKVNPPMMDNIKHSPLETLMEAHSETPQEEEGIYGMLHQDAQGVGIDDARLESDHHGALHDSARARPSSGSLSVLRSRDLLPPEASGAESERTVETIDLERPHVHNLFERPLALGQLPRVQPSLDSSNKESSAQGSEGMAGGRPLLQASSRAMQAQKTEEANAAATLQAVFRGIQARKKRRDSIAALVIQTRLRSLGSRQVVRRIVAVRKIQKKWRRRKFETVIRKVRH